jgi:hypothetical protein
VVISVRAVAVWPPVGYCGTCQGRTRWFEATVGRKTDLMYFRRFMTYAAS